MVQLVTDEAYHIPARPAFWPGRVHRHVVGGLPDRDGETRVEAAVALREEGQSPERRWLNWPGFPTVTGDISIRSRNSQSQNRPDVLTRRGEWASSPTDDVAAATAGFPMCAPAANVWQPVHSQPHIQAGPADVRSVRVRHAFRFIAGASVRRGSQ